MILIMQKCKQANAQKHTYISTQKNLKKHKQKHTQKHAWKYTQKFIPGQAQKNM